MAALVGHALQNGKWKFLQISRPTIWIGGIRNAGRAIKKVKQSKPFIVPPIEKVPFKPVVDSLSCRGFLRKYKEYKPPSNATEKVEEICVRIITFLDYKYKLLNEEKRSQILMACSKEFDHKVPNSLLPSIKTIGDVITFYQTPVDLTVPYDALRNMDLPPNLHIQANYHRFHPDTDTKFGGVSAYPNNSTLVTGLKYREKYRGYTAGTPFHDI